MENEELEQPQVVGTSNEVVEQEEELPYEVVTIDVTVNDVRYCGEAKIDKDDWSVDLGDLLEDDNARAYYHGDYICNVKDILEGEALWAAGDPYCEDVVECDYTGFHVDSDLTVTLANGDTCMENLTTEWDGEYYFSEDCRTEQVRSGYNDYEDVTAPDWYFEDLYWCDCCDSYVDGDDYYGDSECRWCHEDNEEEDDDGDYDGIIEDYCESHYHTPILFGDYKDRDSFIGLGFELEVDCSSSNQYKNGETASNLCSVAGLRSDEMRYAHDGSLEHGFECISQPHTIKAFWDNQEHWRKMLAYLAEQGYRSHDGGNCGLHVHVSRGMFGSNEVDQERAISKVYTFFDENWDELVKISRRKSFRWCSKNELGETLEFYKVKTKYEAWRKRAKYSGGHGVALNNSNTATFEYRLGRGTLNAWSFFSWIDFVLTITKNARRINVEKVTSNDLLSWLGGIKESTAKYIYKRGAFQKEMLALFPNIEWESDLTESNND